MRSKILCLTWVGIMVISSFVLGTFIGPKLMTSQKVINAPRVGRPNQ